MTWNPNDTQPEPPGVGLKTVRKVSAVVRWIVIVVAAGLAMAAFVGITVSALLTAIQE